MERNNWVKHCARWLAALLSGLVGFTAQAAAPPVEHFTKQPVIDSVVPSPSGNHLAVLTFLANGRRNLAVMGLAPISEPKVIAGFGDASITSVQWVNDDRLVFEAYQDGAEIKEGGAGTFAINRDGSGQRQLIAWRYANRETGTFIQSRVLTYGWALHSTLDDGSADVLVYRQTWDTVGDAKDRQLSRLDTVTGHLSSLSFRMPEGASYWLTDARREPRVIVAARDGRSKVYWRDGQATDWTLLEDFPWFSNEGFEPRFLEADGTLIVEAGVKRDTSALYAYDLKARKLNPEPIVAVEGFDLEPELQLDSQTRRVIGVHFRADRPMTYWLDAKLQALQRGLDAALPKGRVNRLLCGRCETTRFIVVHSSSDQQPGEYLLFDRTKSTFTDIGKARPWIDEATQGHRTFHRITARDGLSMPLYVTHPKGAGPKQAVPTVVLVHGGPWVRGGDTLWSADAQFLASRGYRVLEPEYRGSTGFGGRHFRAGWKQWGHAMQDDLVDAVQWAVKEGLTDAGRVCIMGASYGGYAALMGAVRDAGTYRCAVSFAGVTDIELKYSITWSDTPEQWKNYGMPTLIGDREKDAERLRAASPLLRANEIKIPVLLAHGGLDRRVPPEHARKFVAAARGGGARIEEVFYADEGHGWFWPKNQTDFYQRVEKFLAQSLAKPQ